MFLISPPLPVIFLRIAFNYLTVRQHLFFLCALRPSHHKYIKKLFLFFHYLFFIIYCMSSNLC